MGTRENGKRGSRARTKVVGSGLEELFQCLRPKPNHSKVHSVIAFTKIGVSDISKIELVNSTPLVSRASAHSIQLRLRFGLKYTPHRGSISVAVQGRDGADSGWERPAWVGC